MFGLGKTKIPTGAREKIESAKRMRAEGRYKTNETGNGDTRYPSQTIPITIIFVLAVILSFIINLNNASPFTGMHITGIPSVDNFITGADVTAFTGDADEDKVFTLMGRGAVFFALTGFIPLLSFVLDRLIFNRRVMPVVVFWGVSMVMVIFYLFIPADGIMPFFKGIIPFIKNL
jgi:hypothetical protein